MIQEGINEIESPRKPMYRESPGRRINGVEIPTLDTGDDLDRINSPSPRKDHLNARWPGTGQFPPYF